MTRNTNIRFYEEEEEDKRAWEILHSIDKKQFKSQSKFVMLAILDYYEKCMRQEQDPYFETREKEDAFSDKIVKTVEEKVLNNLPALIGNYVMHMQQIPMQNVPITGHPIAANVTGEIPITNVGGQGVISEVEAGTDASKFTTEQDLEPDENEFLDFGMME